MSDPEHALAPSLRRVLHTRPHDLTGVHALRGTKAASWRDALEALLEIHALHLAPLPTLDGAEHWQHHPEVARLKLQLEAAFRRRLEHRCPVIAVEDAVDELRRVAARELVPPVYDWLGDEASLADVVEFIALEGGPDAGFDDLVALCQIGIAGPAKVTLGANYWDEMGRGDPSDVHTELHHRMAEALDLPRLTPRELPIEGLERLALNGLLATNRAWQPELLGGLGLLECQAGPRCRRVVAALRRVGAPADALPFYEEHALADPRHGKEWLDGAVAPLVERTPAWGARIVQGARWRASVNRRFFDALERHFVGSIEDRLPCPRAQAA
ncbi:MAG TPA: iron-containing redox enzyme family protein [Acidimicrobiia bacterium]|nr:iron-containing redox enzyme family protein [Acidimicrobiia bacterium]